MKNLSRSLIIILAFCLSACNTQSLKSRDHGRYADFIQTKGLESKEKVRIQRVVSWQNLDSRYLLISASHKNHLLVKLSGACFNLDSATQLALKQRQNYWLSRHFDSVIAITLHSKDECNIHHIYPISKEQKQELLEMR